MMTKKISSLSLVALLAVSGISQATEISTNTALMQAMDKITGQVDLIEVPVNQEVIFGSFSILVRDCKTRVPEETPDNFAFVDIVDNISPNVGVNIFKGWMVSSSPALNPVAHPVYDVWLLKCVNTQYENAHTMTQEALAERDTITMSRNPDLEYSSLVKNEDVPSVDDDNEEKADGEPEDLIPADLPEKYEQNVADNDKLEEKPEPVVNSDNIPEESGEPEALIVIEEEKNDSTILEDKPQDILDENVEPQPEENILQLEKELSEKAINN